ncbi:MAG: TIM barrel protein [Xanthomonadales bacterium]|nr:sugar phosphate isomerase/epimerase [Xanthomonadales bacterium]NIX11899.1 TIM barrel protein [Xanthomonadales bacterium]
MYRRQFISSSMLTGLALANPLVPGGVRAGQTPLFRISLAQWSLHRSFFGGEYDPVDFARIASGKFGIRAIEYVNQFYFDALSDRLVSELRRRAEGEGVASLLVMVDEEGDLGDPDEKQRSQVVANHHRWADAARDLGCHSIRVNARSAGSWDEQMQRAADGLHALAEYCEKLDLDVLVENHGGLSSNARWLTGVMELADHGRIGTLPDFGNFVIDKGTGERYDRYVGTRELMPFAKAVSAKTYDFDEEGNETTIDYPHIMEIVVDAGYSGWVGIEYEGNSLPEDEGIERTRQLLERVRRQLDHRAR